MIYRDGNTMDQRTLAEIERGRQRAALNERFARVARYKAADGVVIRYHDIPGGYGEAWIIGGVEIAVVDKDAPDYPSDELLAKIALSLAATVGLDHVPELKPSHHVGGKAYNAALRERNKNREDFR